MRDSVERWYAVPLTESLMSCRSDAMACPLPRRGEGSLRQNAGDVPLIIRRGVDIAARFDRALHFDGYSVDRLITAICANQNRGRFVGIDRRLADAAKREPHNRASLLLIQRDNRGNAYQCKIATPTRDLLEAGAAARLRFRIGNFDQHLIRPDIGREQALKEFRSQRLAFAS